MTGPVRVLYDNPYLSTYGLYACTGHDHHDTPPSRNEHYGQPRRVVLDGDDRASSSTIVLQDGRCSTIPPTQGTHDMFVMLS